MCLIQGPIASQWLKVGPFNHEATWPHFINHMSYESYTVRLTKWLQTQNHITLWTDWSGHFHLTLGQSPRQGAKESTQLSRNVEGRKRLGMWALVKRDPLCQKMLVLRYQTLHLLSPPASLQGSCSGRLLWSLFLHPTVRKTQGWLFSIPPAEIFKKGENDQYAYLWKDFLLRVTDLALIKQVYDIQAREILFKKKGI